MEIRRKQKLITQPSFVSSRCMVVVVLSNNFVMTVVMFILMCFDTIVSVFGIASLSWLLLLMVTSLLFPWRLSRQQVSTQLLQVWTLASQKNRPCLWLLLLSRHTVSSRCTYRSAMGWSCHFARQIKSLKCR